jgi:hypothetical protein
MQTKLVLNLTSQDIPHNRHDHCHTLVEGGAELEHQLSADRREGDEPELINDEQVMLESLGQELGQQVLVLCRDQVVDQASGVVEANLVALSAGGQSQSRGDVRLDAPIDLPPLGRMLSAT